MKTKIMTGLVVLIGSVGLLVTGCSTTSNQGAMGDDTQYGGGTGGGAGQVATGADGSVSRTNPFGLETGTGNTPAH